MELKVNNKRVRFFTDIQVTRQFDTLADTFGFQLFFNPDNSNHRELTRIGSYYPCQLIEADELFLTGNLLSQTFVSNEKPNLVTIQGYSKAGALNDSNIPVSLYPLQTEGLSLINIARRLCNPFEIDVTDETGDNSVTSVIDETNATSTQSIGAYLSELASQRNVVLTSNEAGNLVFSKPKVNDKPVFTFERGKNREVTEMQLSFNGQSANSEVTVMKEASDTPADEAGQTTVKNPLVKDAFRPAVKQQSTGDEFDTDKAAKLALADQLRNLQLTINLKGWELDGQIIKPNSIIQITNPELHLYEKTKFFVESVTYNQSTSSKTASLNCVLPEVYGGERQNV